MRFARPAPSAPLFSAYRAESAQLRHFLGLQDAPLPRLEPAQRQRPEPRAAQPCYRMTDGGEHEPDLALAPLMDLELYGSAPARGVGQKDMRSRRRRAPPLQVNAAPQPLQRLNRRRAAHLGHVDLGHLAPRVSEREGE